MKQLTDNFSLEELTRSVTAGNKGIDNNPEPVHVANLRALAKSVLQPARDHINAPVQVNSGYRSRKLNKAIGGSKKSQHCRGEAADISCHDNAVLFNFIRNETVFDQLIWEFGTDQEPAWVHVSHKLSDNRKEVLKAVKVKGKTVYRRL